MGILVGVLSVVCVVVGGDVVLIGRGMCVTFFGVGMLKECGFGGGRFGLGRLGALVLVHCLCRKCEVGTDVIVGTHPSMPGNNLHQE